MECNSMEDIHWSDDEEQVAESNIPCPPGMELLGNQASSLI